MFYDKLQIQQAKQVPIVAYLTSIGFAPVGSSGDSLVYNLREEKTPSCYVNPQKNIFNDFGDTGGDVIKLVCHLHQCDFITAIGILLDFKGEHQSKSFFFNQSNHSHPFKESEKLSLTKVKPLQNKALVSYIEGRGVPFEVASLYCYDVYYTHRERNFFAVGFPNDGDGYELRSKASQQPLCIAPKGITTIQGVNPQHTQVNIFEGFIDFLSALVHFNTNKPQCTTIILNSLVFAPKTYEVIKSYSQVNLFLDTDNAGREATQSYQHAHPRVKDYSYLYADYKDFNEMLAQRTK